jgi:hypothetical protein
MKNIYLDDIRYPYMSHNQKKGLGVDYSSDDKWIIIRDYNDFIDYININDINDINIISYDHDLACYDSDGHEMTGKNAVDYVIEYCLDNNKKFPNWYVHSDNTSGKSNIIRAILNYLKVVEKFDISKFRYFHNGLINNIFV